MACGVHREMPKEGSMLAVKGEGGDYVSVAEQGWPLNHGAALAAPQAALSGSQTKASGFAGGYLLNATVTRFSA